LVYADGKESAKIIERVCRGDIDTPKTAKAIRTLALPRHEHDGALHSSASRKGIGKNFGVSRFTSYAGFVKFSQCRSFLP
jgi:hypothetical protein